MAKITINRNSKAFGYINSLKELWKRVENLNSELPDQFEQSLIEFFKPLDFIHFIGEGSFPTIERITINKRVIKENKRITDPEFLTYPPSECVSKYGRANLKYQSVFYGTFNFPTALNEMQPEIGDLITVSRWKLKRPNEELVVCPIFMHPKQNNLFNPRLLKIYHDFSNDIKKFDPTTQNVINEIQIFLAKCFAKNVNRGNHQAYIFSAMIANKILYEYENGKIDAILYPSTKEGFKSENIAIKPDVFDQKYFLAETVEKKVLNYSKDEFILERTSISKTIENGGRVVWS